jgi:cation:H+ antiporter
VVAVSFAVVAVLGGLVLLVGGGDVLVRGAAGVAERFGTPPLVIGLTVVAMGTSSPELAVTIGAALSGAGDVALGNVVGSNLFNLLVVLGLTALLGGLHVDRALLRAEAPLLVVLTGLVLLAARDGLQQWEGVGLLVGAVVFTLAVIQRTRRAAPPVPASVGTGDPAATPAPPDLDPLAAAAGHRGLGANAGLVVLGLVLLTGGAQLLVGGATDIASGLGVPEVVIGLTVVAAGTSLPELATSLVAAARGQRDIAVGNVLGSNILNLLVVLGAGVAASSGGLAVDPAVLAEDLPVLLVAQVVVLPLLWTRAHIDRVEGLVLLTGFGAYLTLLLAPRALG